MSLIRYLTNIRNTLYLGVGKTGKNKYLRSKTEYQSWRWIISNFGNQTYDLASTLLLYQSTLPKSSPTMKLYSLHSLTSKLRHLSSCIAAFKFKFYTIRHIVHFNLRQKWASSPVPTLHTITNQKIPNCRVSNILIDIGHGYASMTARIPW